MAFRHSHRENLGSRFSEAARLLWLALEKRGESPADCTRRVGAKAGVVARILYGDRLPNLALGVRFEQIYKIAARLWQTLPTEPFVLPAVARRAVAVEARTGTEG